MISRNRIGPITHEIFVYEDDIKPANLLTVREYRNTQVISPPRGYRRIRQTTLYNDLTIESDALLASFNATTRNEVRKAQRAGVAVRVGSLESLIPHFNAFADQKCIAGRDIRSFDWMNGNVYVSEAVLAGAVLAMHSYFLCPEKAIVRLFTSASHFRASANDRAIISAANRYLHFADMLRFKELGFRIYDFGGQAPNDPDVSLRQISKFKQGFGGRSVDHYHYLSWQITPLKLIHQALRLATITKLRPRVC